MASTVIAGKPSNTVGDKDATLILRGSSVKILWGNKFIDLLKNGKINADVKIFKTTEDINSENLDGIYLMNDLVWIIINGTRILLSGSNKDVYVSFLTEQKDITVDLKDLALTNIGFYYNTLEEARLAGIKAGIIYVKGDSKLYVVKDGVFKEYNLANQSGEDILTLSFDKLYISDYSLVVGGDPYITLSGGLIQVHKELKLDQFLQSTIYTDNTGYKLYIDENKDSYLEIDYVIDRKGILPITHKKLLKLIEDKKLVPKKHYLLIDFQNPWEVTWEDEEMLYEDKYEEINGLKFLTGTRNAMKLLIQGRTYDSIEERVWCLEHIDWVIHYDPLYLGKRNGTGEDIQYGFRKRVDANTKKITYLLCKGKITYLKDEYGNEGDFNFRQHLFNRGGDDGEKWRYCLDTKTDDDGDFIGTFNTWTKNNTFLISDYLDTYVLVFKKTEVIEKKDGEEIFTGYTYNFEEKDENDRAIYISRGCNISIQNLDSLDLPQGLITGNYFVNSNDPGRTNKITIKNCLFYDNKFSNCVKDFEIKNLYNFFNNDIDFVMCKDCSIGKKNRNTKFHGNTIKAFLELKVEGNFTNNKIGRVDYLTSFEGDELNFNDNILGDLDDLNLVIIRKIINKGRFERNTIYETTKPPFNEEYAIIENSSIMTDNYIHTIGYKKFLINDKWYSGITNSGTFESNTINQSEVIVNITGSFKNNTIKTSKDYIYKLYGDINDNNILEITGYIRNSSGSINNNNILEITGHIQNSIGSISNNSINSIITVENLGSIKYNILGDIGCILTTGAGSSFDNNQILKITGTGTGTIPEIVNFKTFDKNIIAEINITGTLTNSSTFESNKINKLSNSTLTYKGTITGNIFSNIEIKPSAGNINDNTLGGDFVLDNSNNFSYNKITETNGKVTITNKGTFKTNTIQKITTNAIETTATITNNTILKLSKLPKLSESGKMDNNVIDVIDGTSNFATKSLKNNTITKIILPFNVNTFENNIVEGTLKNIKGTTVTDNTIIGTIKGTTIGSEDSLVILEEFTNNIINGDISGGTFTSFYNNVVDGSLTNSTFTNFHDNNIKSAVSGSEFKGEVTNCIFNSTITGFETNSLSTCSFDSMLTVIFDFPVRNTTFHGTISDGYSLTSTDKTLLESAEKYTDAYPNIKVVYVPEVGGITKGMIIMWYGLKKDVPFGWAICDGENGTPDLRSKFVKGMSYYPDVEDEKKMLGKIDGLRGGEVTLLEKHLPEHRHTFSKEYLSTLGGTVFTKYTEGDKSLLKSSSSTTSSTVGEGKPFSIEPWHMYLYYIMKL